MMSNDVARKVKGDIIFNSNIIMSVINLATKEIAGVSSLVSKWKQKFGKLFFKNSYYEGVKIFTRLNQTIVDVYIRVYNGYNVSEISYRVQENIKNSIASMIDLTIDKINVYVEGVDFIQSEEY